MIWWWDNRVKLEQMYLQFTVTAGSSFILLYQQRKWTESTWRKAVLRCHHLLEKDVVWRNQSWNKKPSILFDNDFSFVNKTWLRGHKTGKRKMVTNAGLLCALQLFKAKLVTYYFHNCQWRNLEKWNLELGRFLTVSNWSHLCVLHRHLF